MLAFAVAGALAAQERPPRIEGRVVDLDTGASVEGASIVLVRLGVGVADSTRAETVTDRAGIFHFERVASGEYQLTVNHIAYGTFDDRVTLATGDRIAVRITLSPTAIALEPVTVEAFREGTLRDRALGTARHRLTAEELTPAARSGDHLANALARLLPGVRVRSGRSQPGQLVCLEFRDPASLAAPGCRTPVVIVDNVRQANGLMTLNTLPIAPHKECRGRRSRRGGRAIRRGFQLRRDPDRDVIGRRPADDARKYTEPDLQLGPRVRTLPLGQGARRGRRGQHARPPRRVRAVAVLPELRRPLRALRRGALRRAAQRRVSSSSSTRRRSSASGI